VPLLPQSIGADGLAKPFLPTPLTITASPSRLTSTPRDARLERVDEQSSLRAKLSIRVSPTAIAAIIAARCEIDLSPGNSMPPLIDPAGRIIILSILDRIRQICLDSNCPKRITYKTYIVSEIREIELPSRIESVEEAAMMADEFAKSRGFGDEVIFAIDLAIRESVANAVKHGNKFDEAKNVDIKFSDSSEGFEITVRDYGTGFSVEDIPDPTNPENLLKSNGRGILFMRSFMDEVEWENPSGGGLIVKMLKKR